MAQTTDHNDDFLTEDPELRGQKYVCLSFISPEDVIMRKDAFAFNRFVGAFARDVDDLFTNLSKFFEGEQAVVDMLETVKSRYDYVFDPLALGKQYAFWKDAHSQDIDKEFDAANKFQTSVRGIKVRGTYETFAEAENRCKQIKRFDPLFDVYVAQVGCWCPWAPRPELLENQEYANDQLNTLMKRYNEAQSAKNEIYQTRLDELVTRAQAHKEGTVAPTGEKIPEDLSRGLEQVDPWLASHSNIP